MELEEGVKLMKCANCKGATYCSRECQKKDYKRHKGMCLTPEERKERNEARKTAGGDGSGMQSFKIGEFMI